MEAEIEIWKDVIGYEGLYEVSNFGNIRGWYCGGYRRAIPKIKKPQKNKNGYYYVILFNGGKSKPKGCTLHRLVLSTFDKYMPSGIDCCHKNHIREDNRLSNLEWGTRKYNESKKKENGTTAVGENNGQSKLSNENILEIRKLFELGMSTNEIAKTLKLKQQNVWCICTRKTWKHI